MAANKKSLLQRERFLLVLVLGVFAVAVINISLFSLRFDLTSAGAYSISAATKNVVGQAKADISITYFLSKKLTTYYPFTEGISDFLDEYAASSGGRVKVKVVDPQESGQINDMPRLGIQAIPIEVVEANQQTQALVYSGIVLQYLDRQEVLPAVSQIETLEYDLTSRVNKLITQKQKTVALLSSDPTHDLQNYFSMLSQAITKNATFRLVQPGEPIGDATVLIVAGSKGFTPALLQPVNDYLMKGGKVLFAVDGVFVDIASNQTPVVVAGDNVLLKALETWGVKVEQSMVQDAYNNVVQFQGNQGVALRRYPQWPSILAKNTSTSNPVTSRFQGLSLMWASPLTLEKKDGITGESLATTSEKSWTVDKDLSIDVDWATRSAMDPGVKFSKHDVVVALSGAFPSALPGGGVSPETRILVVGSSNFLTNLMQILGNDENTTFVENAVDWLAQDDALLKIKTRAYRDKSLTLLQDERVRENAAFALSFVTLFIVPLVVLLIAVVRLIRRRRRENKPTQE